MVSTDCIVYILEHSTNGRTFMDMVPCRKALDKAILQENGLLRGGHSYTKKFLSTGEWNLKVMVEGLKKYEALNMLRTLGSGGRSRVPFTVDHPRSHRNLTRRVEVVQKYLQSQKKGKQPPSGYI